MSDKVVLGISDNKVFYIITDKDEEIKTYIMDYLKHGVTIFDVKSGYKNKNDNVLMTVLPTKDYYRLREGIKEIDRLHSLGESNKRKELIIELYNKYPYNFELIH